MGKPLKDWTLEEIQDYCLGIRCRGCEFCIMDGYAIQGCRVASAINGDDPTGWDLSEPCTLTEPELAICRAVGGTRLTRGNNDMYVLMWGPDGEVVAKFVASKFPSVQKGTDMEVPDG